VARTDGEGASSEASFFNHLSPVEAARAYAEHGWRVFPVNGKRPLVQWKDGSTTDTELIDALWEAHSGAGVAIATGTLSNLVVLDADGPQGLDTLRSLFDQHGASELLLTTLQATTGKGRHYYFTHPGGHAPNSASKLGAGLDVRGDGGFVVAPPSQHPDGGRYRFANPAAYPLELPAPVARALTRERAARNGARSLGDAAPVPHELRDAVLERVGVVNRVSGAVEGARNATLNVGAFRLGRLVGEGKLDLDRTVAELVGAARECGLDPPEIPATIRSGLEAGAAGTSPLEPAPVTEVVAAYRREIYLPDDTPLLGVLGAVAGNLLEGDPVWMLLVGPPSGGKTALIEPLGALSCVYPVGALTEAALLSGTSRKERAAHARGGLLREIGDFGIALTKDFGSVLSMSGDQRLVTLAALREVFDGSWVRHVGTDGGQQLAWTGKLGLIGGVTPTIDRHHAVTAALGDRYMLQRLPPTAKRKNQPTRLALKRKHSARQVRETLGAVVQRAFVGVDARKPRELDDDETERLGDLADFVAVCRSAVERGGGDFEIELVPDSEGSARLALQLRGLLYGLDVLGVARQRAWQVVTRTALDSMPALRLRVIRTLASHGEMETPKVAEAIGHPTKTTKRALEDLTAHGAVARSVRGTGRNADRWVLSDWIQQFICEPETAEPRQGRDAPPYSLPLSTAVSGSQTGAGQ
jgi:hypothetical protein